MVTLLQPAAIWQQLGSFCFLLSGLFGDILVIRICLFLAYTWLLTAACVGYPQWPNIKDGPSGQPGFISLDGIIWAVLNLIFHGTAMFQMLWDERRIHFKDPEHEALWRFFYRRSGMGKLEFKQTVKHSRRAQFKAGEVILGPSDAHTTLMLLLEGFATYTFKDPQGRVLKGDTPLLSGNTFDIGLLNVLGVYIGFEKHQSDLATVTARTDCIVYFWELQDLDTLATRYAPAVSSFWRSFALCQVGLEWHSRVNSDQPPINGRGQREPEGIRKGTARSSDFSDELEPYEDPKPTLTGILAWLPSKLAPFLPPGMRHTAMPRAGALARNRLMALSAANRSADSVLRNEPLAQQFTSRVILRSLAASGQWPPEAVTDAAGPSKHADSSPKADAAEAGLPV